MENSKWKREGKKRISLDIHEDIYKQVKILAVIYNTTITKYITRALIEKMIVELNHGLIDKDFKENYE